MTKETRTALAAFLNASAGLLTAFSASLGSNTAEPAATAEPVAPETPKATRRKAAPPVEAPAAPAEPAAPAAEKPADPIESLEPADETEAPATGKTYEDMQKVIEPLVKATRGLEVKKVIAKYSPSGKLVDMDPKHYADFEKDIDALTY